MKRVLFVCTQNSSRSQMAEGLINGLYGSNFQAESAGTKPFRVNPLAIQAMADLGLDISRHRSKGIDELAGQEFDYIVTVCDQAQEDCPYYPGDGEHIHHSFTDPAAAVGTEEERLQVFIKVRDEIRNWLEQFVKQHK